MKTLAEATGARPSEVPAVEGEDEATVRARGQERKTRSFRVLKVDEARLQATLAGIQARAYGTDLEGKVPRSLGDLVGEGLIVVMSYYEDLFNEGREFSRANVRLQPGPVPGNSRQRADRFDARVGRQSSTPAGSAKG